MIDKLFSFSAERKHVAGKECALIVVLNGSPRKNGNTSALVREFTKGTESTGNAVAEKFLNDMDIHGCLGCFLCRDCYNDKNILDCRALGGY